MLEKNVYALKEAKSMFLPNISFSTTYTKADGGRTIDFPTGDLLNGAYATLNQLTGSNSFPQLHNERILLNPDNFYDAKFRTSLPILNAELIYNKRIKLQQVDLQKSEVLLYKRELVKEIKTAYYKYIKAINAIKIFESSLRLVEEGQRINTALFNNSKVNRTAVIRSNNEVSKISSSLITANKTAESARYYFNFLR
jgi:outer membrane protein TolC